MDSNKHLMLGTWFTLIAMLFFGLAFFPFSGFLPPMSAALTAEEVATSFQQHTNGIRFSMILLLEAGAFFCVLVAVISTQIKRIEGVSSILSYTQIISGAVGSVIIIIGGVIMLIAVYRPDRPGEITYMLFDAAWMFIVMPSTSYTLQFFCIGIAILSDKRATPLFPKWVGYYNFWTGLAIFPGLLIPWFKTGPFAWNGLLSFWVGVAAFGGWFIIMFFMLRRSIRQP